MKILIIDDDTVVAGLWAKSLKAEGFEVIFATTGKDGIELAKKDKPDFILLDQIMPDMKGNDVLQILKKDPQTTTIPVAIASNYSEEALMKDAIQKGAVDYILKFQVEPEDLVHKIKILAKGAKSAA